MSEIDLWINVGAGKHRLITNACPKYDVLIAGFNLSARAKAVFDIVDATDKYWLIHPEYGFSGSELPKTGNCLVSNNRNEADFTLDTIGSVPSIFGKRIAIDITGMMRPSILFLMHYLRFVGVNSYDMLYTDPGRYKRQSETVFSSDVYEVRQVCGYEGVHNPDMSSDVLIVGTGYDHELVARVINARSSAKLVQMYSLPSLSADMYQESILRLERVVDSPYQASNEQSAFASANDPFVTCGVLQQTVERLRGLQSITNLYLSPLATKPQVLGFGLFFQSNLRSSASSVVFPFAMSYDKETSTGVGKSWVYPVRLPLHN
jgi:hypothetical protein